MASRDSQLDPHPLSFLSVSSLILLCVDKDVPHFQERTEWNEEGFMKNARKGKEKSQDERKKKEEIKSSDSTFASCQ